MCGWLYWSAGGGAGRQVPAFGRPHEAAFINAPAAGCLLGGYSPIRHADTLHRLPLVCGEGNNVARPDPAIDAQHASSEGEVRTYANLAQRASCAAVAAGVEARGLDRRGAKR